MFQRKSDGFWIARVAVRDEYGRPSRVEVARARKEDAMVELQRLKARRATKGSMAEFLEMWLRDVARPRVDIGTYEQYEADVRKRLIPYVGKIDLSVIDARRVAGLLTAWRGDGVPIPTQRKARATLRNALETAVAWGMIPGNPVAGVPAPTYDPEERPTLDVERARRLIEIIADDRLGGIYVVAISMGLRQGEIFGLQWGDLDFERGILTLRHSLQERGGKLRLKGLKRRRQRRELPLPPIVLDALRSRRAAAEAEARDVAAGYVFTAMNGQPLRKANFHRDSWSRLRAKLNLPLGVHLHFHDLRHTLGTLQKLLGADVETRRQQLGHASSKTTADVYGHVAPEELVAIARAIDALLRPPAEPWAPPSGSDERIVSLEDRRRRRA